VTEVYSDPPGTFRNSRSNFRPRPLPSISISIHNLIVSYHSTILNLTESVVSDYGLGDRGSIPGRVKDFSSSLCVQTGCAVYPTEHPVSAKGSFSGVCCSCQWGETVLRAEYLTLWPADHRWSSAVRRLFRKKSIAKVVSVMGRMKNTPINVCAKTVFVG
jgi:hypothetical protein